MFSRKVVISGFGCGHGDFGSNSECGRTKFTQFVL